MIRIRGTVGDWPVDLTIELDDDDWARLGAQVSLQADSPATEAVVKKPAQQNDALWQNVLSLVQGAGQISGPALLEQLEGLSGSTAAGKRLLVRLRHCSQVRVQSGADAPLYCWVGA